MLKKIALRMALSIAVTACGSQDALIQVSDSARPVERVSSVASANPENPSDPSGTVRIIAPKESEELPYAKFKLIFSIEDSDQLKDYTIKLDGQVISSKLAAGRILYVEKDMPITSCYMGTIIFPGKHQVEVSYHDSLGNELTAEASFSLNQ